VGKAHLEGFGGIEGVKKGKGELYEYLAASGGTVFISFDNPALMEMKEKTGVKNVVYYGTSDDSKVQARVVKISPHLKIEWWHTGKEQELHDIHSHLTGAYNAENMLAAICIGDHFDVDDDKIDLGIAGYHPNNNRSQIQQTEKNTVVCDFYNANPSSMDAALENFARLDGQKKTLILADMLELGIDSPAEHETVIRHALEIPDAECIFIGPDFGRFKADFTAHFFERTSAAKEWLEKNPVENSTVLLKGSRGMKLEELLPLL
ncbi:MAG: UDP-N-acetylmuramoyl-tripeptide--D-alanyl-D-alanine ligase, partial [Mucilaginibacter polytrichastri]|nr:UDP-N-acetylmuramoyl-tripeptide--D-alanyl-D-alanine ligase [Mucilaginibacter polytrichastri]